MAINNVVLVGRLTRDPELRYTTGNGLAITRFTLAVDRGLSKDKKTEAESKGQPTADFIGCTAFGKTAELISTYVKKGQQLAITGRIQTSSYKGQDGKMVYRTDVIVERMQFIDKGNKTSNKDGFEPSDDFGLGDDAFPLDDDMPF